MTDEKKLLVTGISGFVGHYVREAVNAGGFGRCQLQTLPTGLDIRDADGVGEALAALQPDWVLHLAAQSQVPAAFKNPAETLHTNLLGTLNLLLGLKQCASPVRLVYVSSGDVYGAVPERDLPVTEDRVPVPRNPYAVSKLSAEHLCRQWWMTEGLDVVIVRPFNHIGPAQDTRFVVPSLARQVIDVAEGRASAISVGDIDVSRDFSDVRDVVRGYACALQAGRSGATYNISSGRETFVREILMTFCRLAGIDPAISQDPDRIRPSEQRRMVASYAALQQDTGWTPSIGLERSLGEILEHMRKNEGK